MTDSTSPPQHDGSAPISLSIVRKLFARPARIADSSFLRREIASRMFERLDLIRANPATVLDAGCGEGADLPVLQQRYPQARLLGLDAAAPMLAAAVERRRGAMSSMNRLFARLLPKGGAGVGPAAADLICADLARLPLGAGSIDLLWSNLALHWHPQPDLVFAEWMRVLRTDSLLMFSCFGPDTMRELREASGPGRFGSLPFVDMHDLGDMLVQAGFATPVMDMEKIRLTYDTADRLLADVKALGGNPLRTRRTGLTGRAERDRLYHALEASRGADGKLSLTIEVIYGHAFRPQPRTTAAGESIVRFMPRK